MWALSGREPGAPCPSAVGRATRHLAEPDETRLWPGWEHRPAEEIGKGLFPVAQSQVQTALSDTNEAVRLGGDLRAGGVSPEGFLGGVTLLLAREDILESLPLSYLPQESGGRPPVPGCPELAVIQPLAKQVTEKPKLSVWFFKNNLLT